MHCKFWSFAYHFFFLSFLPFFSSACEFQFIERIGAHGKQNPLFIIIISRQFFSGSVRELSVLSAPCTPSPKIQ